MSRALLLPDVTSASISNSPQPIFSHRRTNSKHNNRYIDIDTDSQPVGNMRYEQYNKYMQDGGSSGQQDHYTSQYIPSQNRVVYKVPDESSISVPLEPSIDDDPHEKMREFKRSRLMIPTTQRLEKSVRNFPKKSSKLSQPSNYTQNLKTPKQLSSAYRPRRCRKDEENEGDDSSREKYGNLQEYRKYTVLEMTKKVEEPRRMTSPVGEKAFKPEWLSLKHPRINNISTVSPIEKPIETRFAHTTRNMVERQRKPKGHHKYRRLTQTSNNIQIKRSHSRPSWGGSKKSVDRSPERAPERCPEKSPSKPVGPKLNYDYAGKPEILVSGAHSRMKSDLMSPDLIPEMEIEMIPEMNIEKSMSPNRYRQNREYKYFVYPGEK